MATFSERLIEALKIRHITAAELSRKSGIPESVMSQYKQGLYIPKQRRLDKLSQLLNVSVQWLLGEDVPMERITNIVSLNKVKKVPLLGEIACGDPILAEENWEELIALPEGVKADFALNCKGDSMINADIQDGDIVYINSQPSVDNGQIAAVLIENEATLKRIYIYDDKVVLQPENSKYSPFVYSKEEMNNIRILGKAVGLTRIFN